MKRGKLIFRWCPLVAVGVFFVSGLVLGFFYSMETEQGQAWTLSVIQSASKSEAFNFYGSIGLLWYAICVVIAGRSTWPVTKVRALVMYGPMAFAFGFAARFFALLFGFTVPLASMALAQDLAQYALAIFLYLVFLVGLPTYGTFVGAFIKDELVFRKLCGILVVLLLIMLWVEYA